MSTVAPDPKTLMTLEWDEALDLTLRAVVALPVKAKTELMQRATAKIQRTDFILISKKLIFINFDFLFAFKPEFTACMRLILFSAVLERQFPLLISDSCRDYGVMELNILKKIFSDDEFQSRAH